MEEIDNIKNILLREIYIIESNRRMIDKFNSMMLNKVKSADFMNNSIIDNYRYNKYLKLYRTIEKLELQYKDNLDIVYNILLENRTIIKLLNKENNNGFSR